jgi:hypothetical protein
MSELSKEGALYELISRGEKDKYFQNDTLSALSPFRNNYKRLPSFIHERRQIPCINNVDFNKTIEFEFEVSGDIYTHPTLLIDLPTWYPSDYAKLNNTSLIKDTNNISYGYTNGIGYFLFENIQIYQDQILLQEFSGDALYATRLSRGSLNSANLENELIGYHDGSTLSIARNATPPTLRLELPLLGCQHIDEGGFPSFGVRSQVFRMRCKLRALEDLVESSDGQTKPTPWSKNYTIQTSSTGQPIPFTSIERYNIEAPTIYLETRHVYIDSNTQKELVEKPLEIPFSRLYENIFYYNDRDYAPLNNNVAGVASVFRRIDAVHPASRLVFFLRQKSDIESNRLWKITSDLSNNEYYNNISLLIGSRDRETSFSSIIWNTVTQHAKEDRYSGSGLGIMNWDLGEQRGKKLPYARQPEGSVNFSTADRPTLYIELQKIAGSNRNTEMRLIVDVWASYELENGRGSLKYAN